MQEPFGADLAKSSATDSTPPPLVPVKMPSVCASFCAVDMAALPDTCASLSKYLASDASDSNLGMKSVAHPCSKCGRH